MWGLGFRVRGGQVTDMRGYLPEPLVPRIVHISSAGAPPSDSRIRQEGVLPPLSHPLLPIP